MNKNVNFQQKLDTELEMIREQNLQGIRRPRLLLHSCCAPCSSYVLEYLNQYFEIVICFYNPNISEETEYQKRVNELKRLVKEMPLQRDIQIIEGTYEPQDYYDAVAGLELLGERSKRCYVCYELRMRYAAKRAKERGDDYFTTTLSISPHKNATWLNEIGEMLSREYGVPYLYADFKKKNGYKRSIELSSEYHLYRQDYCGCVFSKKEEMVRKNASSPESSN